MSRIIDVVNKIMQISGVMNTLRCENRFCLHKTEIRTDGETLQKLFGKGLSPGEHSLAAEGPRSLTASEFL